MTKPPNIQDLTAEQIQDHLANGEEVWLVEHGTPKHKVQNVDLGKQECKIHFRGAFTGRVFGKPLWPTETIAVAVRPRPASPGEPNGQATPDEEDSLDEVQHP
jgi:hypothetical protein